MKQSPEALRHAKRLLASSRNGSASETLAEENRGFGALLAGVDTRQRVHALLARLAAAEGA
jgi:enoyl-CoA hydratase/carnithine racemase